MILSFIINSLVVALAVILHYEFLYHATRMLPHISSKPRFRIVFGVFSALIAHAIEIWLFALAYYLKLQHGGFGDMQGNFDGSLYDCVYFSFSVYTTVGFGDIYPLGYLRFLTGIEALTGLVLITWTASFLYVEMQKLWSSG